MEIDTTTLGDVEVGVDVADVDVDLDEVLRQKLGVGALMSVDVEDLAIAAPITTEVYEDALVLAMSLSDGGVEVMLRGGDFGVDVLWRWALRDSCEGERCAEKQSTDCPGKCSCCGHCVGLKTI